MTGISGKDGDGDLEQLAVFEESPSHSIEVNEEMRQALEILRMIPNKIRQPYLLAHYHGFTYGQIAKAQGIVIGTVKSRINSAKRKIEKLAEEMQPLNI